MGTYNDSKYVTARRSFQCADCGHMEAAGMRYLAYKPGLKSTVKVCYLCSLKVVDDRAKGKRAMWLCRATEEEIAMIKRKAAEPFTSVSQLGANDGSR